MFSSQLLSSIKIFLYQVPLRFYELFLVGDRSSGLSFFGLSIMSILFCIQSLMVKFLIPKNGIGYIVLSLSICIGGGIAFSYTFILKDIDKILQNEWEKGLRFNRKWRLITWGYILFDIILIVLTSFIL
jgi:hypothetical protein